VYYSFTSPGRWAEVPIGEDEAAAITSETAAAFIEAAPWHIYVRLPGLGSALSGHHRQQRVDKTEGRFADVELMRRRSTDCFILDRRTEATAAGIGRSAPGSS
jgi:hypothetical protein